MQGIEKKERELILELSRIESRIAEIQSLIDYLPADLAEFHKESLRLQKLIDQIHAKKERVLQKVGECTRLESIEQENLDKTARLLKITRDQKVHNSAKRYEDQTRKILTQLHYVMQSHTEKIAELDKNIADLVQEKNDFESKLEMGQKSLSVGHDNLRKELTELRAAEKTLRLKLPAKILQSFDQISSRNIRPVAVLAETGRCPACLGTFPDRQLQEMMAGSILHCQNCRRLMTAFIPAVAEADPQEQTD